MDHDGAIAGGEGAADVGEKSEPAAFLPSGSLLFSFGVRIELELVRGLEPLTCRLQGGCSTFELHQPRHQATPLCFGHRSVGIKGKSARRPCDPLTCISHQEL